MSETEYVIFCDESDRRGKYYSNFYGGVLVGASQYQRVTRKLEDAKQSLNLYGEVKWEKVTERYLPKYQALMKRFFDELAVSSLKVRVMFRQNAFRPRGLTPEHVEMEYFLLYYQFIKHAFGLTHIKPRATGTRLRLYFDQFPDTREKAEQFKGFLLGLAHNVEFRAANIRLSREDITEVRSHRHVLLQCLDIILGSMAFRLNDKHKRKLPGKRSRGKRTRAKEQLYKTILGEIRKLHSGFNIGVTTSTRGKPRGRWELPYMHWSFVPKGAEFDRSLTKARKRS